MDIESTIEDRSKIFELLALANEELWVGHFFLLDRTKHAGFQTLRHH